MTEEEIEKKRERALKGIDTSEKLPVDRIILGTPNEPKRKLSISTEDIILRIPREPKPHQINVSVGKGIIVKIPYEPKLVVNAASRPTIILPIPDEPKPGPKSITDPKIALATSEEPKPSKKVDIVKE